MPRFCIEKAFRRRSISFACPHHLSNCNPHLMPSLCNQLWNRDVKVSALTWTTQGRYFAYFSSPTISRGSKTVPHLVTGNIKAAPAVHNWCCPSHRRAGHAQDEDVALFLSRRSWMHLLYLKTPLPSNIFIWRQMLHSHRTSLRCSALRQNTTNFLHASPIDYHQQIITLCLDPRTVAQLRCLAGKKLKERSAQKHLSTAAESLWQTGNRWAGLLQNKPCSAPADVLRKRL